MAIQKVIDEPLSFVGLVGSAPALYSQNCSLYCKLYCKSNTNLKMCICQEKASMQKIKLIFKIITCAVQINIISGLLF